MGSGTDFIVKLATKCKVNDQKLRQAKVQFEENKLEQSFLSSSN